MVYNKTSTIVENNMSGKLREYAFFDLVVDDLNLLLLIIFKESLIAILEWIYRHQFSYYH